MLETALYNCVRRRRRLREHSTTDDRYITKEDKEAVGWKSREDGPYCQRDGKYKTDVGRLEEGERDSKSGA